MSIGNLSNYDPAVKYGATILTDEVDSGDALPNGVAGYSEGAIFHVQTGQDVLAGTYINVGTADNSDFVIANPLPPRQLPMKKLKETTVFNFQSGHGTTKQSAEGTQSDDTDIYFRGDQSLLQNCPDGETIFSRKSSISPTIDLTGAQPVLYFRTDNIDAVDDIWIFLSSDNFSADWYTFKVDDDKSFVINDEWTRIVFNFSEVITTGTPDRSAINSIQIRTKHNGNNTDDVNVWWGGVGSVPEPSASRLSLSFDDGWASQFEEARKKMDEYSMVGTLYVIPDLIGTDGYMTLAQLKELHRAGWDISAHELTDLTSVSPREAEIKVKKVKQWLIQNGFSDGADHFAYPNGAFNAETEEIMRRYFTTARTIVSRNETLPPSNPYRLQVYSVVQSSATATVDAQVTGADTNKAWLILNFHKIVTTPAVSTEYSIADFGTVIDNIVTNGITVKTVSEVVKENV